MQQSSLLHALPDGRPWSSGGLWGTSPTRQGARTDVTSVDTPTKVQAERARLRSPCTISCASTSPMPPARPVFRGTGATSRYFPRARNQKPAFFCPCPQIAWCRWAVTYPTTSAPGPAHPRPVCAGSVISSDVTGPWTTKASHSPRFGAIPEDHPTLPAMRAHFSSSPHRSPWMVSRHLDRGAYSPTPAISCVPLDRPSGPGGIPSPSPVAPSEVAGPPHWTRKSTTGGHRHPVGVVLP